jgi:hypothetical protein
MMEPSMKKPIVITGLVLICAVCFQSAEEPITPVIGYSGELQKYVRDGFVDYRSWSGDRKGLDAFVASLRTVKLEILAPDEKKALLINAYNACMVWMILEHYPVNGVSDIKPKPFKQAVFNLGGRKVSLDHIEHQELRKMGDPRIHFAIVCASKGCPDLVPEIYTAEILDEQLDTAASRYFSQPKGLQVKTDPPAVKLSMLFDWFGDDFGGNKGERLQFVARYAPGKWQKMLKRKNPKVALSYIEYDWSLNGK